MGSKKYLNTIITISVILLVLAGLVGLWFLPVKILSVYICVNTVSIKFVSNLKDENGSYESVLESSLERALKKHKIKYENNWVKDYSMYYNLFGELIKKENYFKDFTAENRNLISNDDMFFLYYRVEDIKIIYQLFKEGKSDLAFALVKEKRPFRRYNKSN